MPKQLGVPNTGPELRKLVCDEAFSGIPLITISDQLDRPLPTIQSIVKRGKERGHNEDNPRSGRPSKINDRALHQLNRHVTHN